MSSVVLTGDTSGSGTITVPAVAGTFTATIGSATGTHYPFTAGTAVAATSGTSIDFTSIPSWVKRITVMFSGVSTNGTSIPLIQIGDSGGIETTSYDSFATGASTTADTTRGGTSTDGFRLALSSASSSAPTTGKVTICLLSSNTWIAEGTFITISTYVANMAGSKTLSGTLDRVRITTTNGTDTFDAGSINILYE
jgi:hypothetical protein